MFSEKPNITKKLAVYMLKCFKLRDCTVQCILLYLDFYLNYPLVSVITTTCISLSTISISHLSPNLYVVCMSGIETNIYLLSTLICLKSTIGNNDSHFSRAKYKIKVLKVGNRKEY